MGNLPMAIPPGFVLVDSPNAARGRFTGGDQVRFDRGKAEKRAGWEALLAEQVEGKARALIAWVNFGGNTNISIGTHLRLYAILGGADDLTNITPIRDADNLTDPFTTTDESAVVAVADASHGLTEGDYVRFSGASAVGGITIDGEYTVTTVTNGNAYTITHTAPATSSAGPGGGTVAYEYEIAVGLEHTAEGVGYGAGPYGEEEYGDERASGITLEARFWSLSEYGNDILALPSGGTLYYWDESTMTEAEAVSGAPASARAMFVTGERFVFLLGTTTPMTVQWPDQDDFTDWVASEANTANSRRLQVGSKLIGGVSVAAGVSLVWSDKGIYLFQYDGSSISYQSRVVADNAGLIGPKAFIVVNSTAYWMSGHDFHFYNGGVGIIPNAADINDFVFGDMEDGHLTKTFCRYVEKTNEVMWVYASEGETEPNKYVAVSLEDYSWTTGTWNEAEYRTCAGRFRPGDSSSLMIDDEGTIFVHETGKDANGAALRSYIEFGGLFSAANGQKNVDIMGFIPDCERQSGVLTLTVYTKDRPNSANRHDQVSTTLSANTEIADIRVHGRHVGFTLESNTVGGDYRLGIPSLEIQDAGERR